ncbi:DNA-directed RNA polymerase subunit H [Candidatus Woesearchaeota archaeon]|nr:DNA-directed RNA polymerase subunit H [Candidatus Woesearchaeota archaeon]
MAKKRSARKIIVGKHELIPKHSKISEKEKKQLMERYHITSLKEFPKIFKNDAGLQGLNVKTGDIVKITRQGPTGESVYYRVVVSA